MNRFRIFFFSIFIPLIAVTIAASAESPHSTVRHVLISEGRKIVNSSLQANPGSCPSHGCIGNLTVLDKARIKRTPSEYADYGQHFMEPQIPVLPEQPPFHQSEQFNQVPPQIFDHPPPRQFDQQSEFDEQPEFEEQPKLDEQQPQNFDQAHHTPLQFNQPQQQFQQPPPQFTQPPQQFQQPPPQFNQPQQQFQRPPPQFNQPYQNNQPPPQFNHPQQFNQPQQFQSPQLNQPQRFNQPKQQLHHQQKQFNQQQGSTQHLSVTKPQGPHDSASAPQLTINKLPKADYYNDEEYEAEPFYEEVNNPPVNHGLVSVTHHNGHTSHPLHHHHTGKEDHIASIIAEVAWKIISSYVFVFVANFIFGVVGQAFGFNDKYLETKITLGKDGRHPFEHYGSGGGGHEKGKKETYSLKRPLYHPSSALYHHPTYQYYPKGKDYVMHGYDQYHAIKYAKKYSKKYAKKAGKYGLKPKPIEPYLPVYNYGSPGWGRQELLQRRSSESSTESVRRATIASKVKDPPYAYDKGVIGPNIIPSISPYAYDVAIDTSTISPDTDDNHTNSSDVTSSPVNSSTVTFSTDTYSNSSSTTADIISSTESSSTTISITDGSSLVASKVNKSETDNTKEKQE